MVFYLPSKIFTGIYLHKVISLLYYLGKYIYVTICKIMELVMIY